MVTKTCLGVLQKLYNVLEIWSQLHLKVTLLLPNHTIYSDQPTKFSCQFWNISSSSSSEFYCHAHVNFHLFARITIEQIRCILQCMTAYCPSRAVNSIILQSSTGFKKCIDSICKASTQLLPLWTNSSCYYCFKKEHVCERQKKKDNLFLFCMVSALVVNWQLHEPNHRQKKKSPF